MAQGIPLQGITSGNGVEANTSSQLLVTLPNPTTLPATVGAAIREKLIDAGAVTGTPLLRSGNASLAGRDSVGLDNILDFEIFDYASQNTNKHSYTSSTMTMALASQALKTNASGITTASTYAFLKSFRYFPVLGGGINTTFAQDFATSSALSGATNTNVYLGLLLPNNGGVPLDGFYFKLTNAGVYGVGNYSGTETAIVGPFLASSGGSTFFPTIGQVYQYKIVANDSQLEFHINGKLMGIATVPAGQGQMCMSQSLPWAVVHAIGGTAAGAVFSVQISDYEIFNNDLAWNKPFDVQAIDAGGNALSGQQGQTQGQLANYANGTAPTAAGTWSNTAAAYTTKGGLWVSPTTYPTPGETDNVLFAWQNPAGTASAPGKTYYLNSVDLGEMWALAALTGGPFIASYAIGIGSTAASGATTESGSFSSGTTKISRKSPLGTQVLAAAAAQGTVAPGRVITFKTPLPIQPGEYLHIFVRVQGVVLTAGTIRGSIGLDDGFFA